MVKSESKLLVGSVSMLWQNGKKPGSVATTVPKGVREALGIESGQRMSWVPVGLSTAFVRRLGPRLVGEPEGYRRGLETEDWAVRIGAVSSMLFPKGGSDPDRCAICREGRSLAAVIPMAVCVECDLAIAAAVAQQGSVVQEGLDLESGSEGSDGDGGAGGSDGDPADVAA